MTKVELYQIAEKLADAAIASLSDKEYEALAQHFKDNWSIDHESQIRMAMRECFGLRGEQYE